MSNLIKKHENESSLPGFLNRVLGQDFFGDFFDGNIPAINIKESKKKYELDVSVPGYNKEDLEVRVMRDILTISGKQTSNREEKDEDGTKVLRCEFSSSSFSRSFTLPMEIDTDHIEVKRKDGILKITLPKSAEAKEDKVKKLEIK